MTVAMGRNQAEADLIANLLLEEGIPSLVRRSAGADVPEMLAAGAARRARPRVRRAGRARRCCCRPTCTTAAAPRARRRASCSRPARRPRRRRLVVWLVSLAAG